MGPMLITGTGLGLLAAFAAGVLTGTWWLMVGPIAGVLLWSAVARGTRKRAGWSSVPEEWRPAKHEGVRWTSRN